MAIDLFETRTMLEALDQMYPPRTFLRDTFFTRTDPVETENIDIDIYKGKRRTAAYVSSEAEGQVVSRIGFTTFTYKPPYIKQKKALKPRDLITRTAGSTIYMGESPLQRQARQVAVDLQDLDDMITRAEEVQCAQALFQGKTQLLDGNWLIFPQSPTHLITAMQYLWSDTVNSDPLKDAGIWRRQLIRDSGIAPDTMIFGADAINAFVEHPKVGGNTGALSSVKVDRGQINPQLLEEGVTYWGYIAELGCDIYSYDEWYIPPGAPDTSEAVPMMPLNGVWMGSKRARMDMAYGPIMNIKAGGLVPVKRFPTSWITDDPSVRWMMLESAPLAIPVQLDSFLFAQVVALSKEQLG